MRTVFLFLCLSVMLSGAPAEPSCQAVRQAQALLGPDTWSRVVRIENTNAHSVYPRSLYALVFEFSGILWFYTETDGTQSFSLWTNRLEQEKSDFHLQLLKIEPGFATYSLVDDTVDLPARRRELPNGCLIESLVLARERLGRDATVQEIRLVMYYAKQRRAGHCVIAYATARGVFVIDPAQSSQPYRVGEHWPRNSMEIIDVTRADAPRLAISAVRTLDLPLSSLSSGRTSQASLARAAQSAASAGSARTRG